MHHDYRRCLCDFSERDKDVAFFRVSGIELTIEEEACSLLFSFADVLVLVEDMAEVASNRWPVNDRQHAFFYDRPRADTVTDELNDEESNLVLERWERELLLVLVQLAPVLHYCHDALLLLLRKLADQLCKLRALIFAHGLLTLGVLNVCLNVP